MVNFDGERYDPSRAIHIGAKPVRVFCMTRTGRAMREEVKATLTGQYGHGLSMSCRNVERD